MGAARELYDQGRFREAAVVAARALDQRAVHQPYRGAPDPETAALQHELALIDTRLARYPEAQRLLEQAVTGLDDIARGFALADLGRVHGLCGRFDRGEQRYREALAILELRVGIEQPEVAVVLSYAAALQRDAGRLDQASAMSMRALRQLTRKLGDTDARLAQGYMVSAFIAAREQSWLAAMGDLRRARLISERALPAGHPQIGGCILLGAYVMLHRGSALDAAELSQEAVDLYEESLGDSHPLVGLALGRLADALLKLPDLDEAEAMAERALAIYQASFGPEHAFVAAHEARLARIRASRV